MEDALSDLVRDINKLRLELTETRQQDSLLQQEFFRKLTYITRVVEDLKEKTWELDTNTRNNLVFYGLKEDGTGGNSEWAVRELIKTQLHISRELNLTRCQRLPELEARQGVRPVMVQFEKHAVSRD